MEKTTIDALIDHSKAINKYKAFLRLHREYMFMLARTPDTLPSEKLAKKYNNDIKEEVHRRIAERNEACKKLLLVVLGGEKYGYTNQFSFSNSELRDGYILLHKTPHSIVPDKVLFLSSVQGIGANKNLKFRKGDVITYEKCMHILKYVKGVITPSERVYSILTSKKI